VDPQSPRTGDFVCVLHGHMPWVVHHGRWPHGMEWLYEAASGVWLPLLDLVEGLAARGIRAPLTLGITPILLEQLRHPVFRAGFAQWLADRRGRASRDAAEFDAPQGRALALRWEEHHARLLARFEGLDRDLVGAFAGHARAGRIELLSSFATHGYAPLLLHDASVRAQLRIGLQTSERHLGFRPRGIWLPECGFRPASRWTPPMLHGDERWREGVDRILEQEGVSHFFVDAHLFAGARSEGVWEGGRHRKVSWEAVEAEPTRGWRSVLEPHRVHTQGGAGEVVAFARHPGVSEQVWSREVGYPGDGAYLEFHKKRGGDGLRYWRVTDPQADLGDKGWYEPGWAEAATEAHARHFIGVVRGALRGHKEATGRAGCVVAPFDAELFGHWWFEGPRFLERVFEALHGDPEVQACTAEERLRARPPDKVCWLPEGSWGDGGDHRVWLNDKVGWTLEAAWRAEDRFLGLVWEVDQMGRRPPGQRKGLARARRLRAAAARELLLLQASDWAFVVTTGGALEYGYRRLSLHQERFERLCNLAWDLLAGRDPQGPDGLGPLHEAEAAAHDDCFAGLDVGAWR
jgi:1,4-alpha-glucan branching enzyme